jgi:Uma2 family endonuclease
MNTAVEAAPRRAPPPIEMPPTQDDLPCDDGVPMETERHHLQMALLLHTITPWLDGKGYAGGDMFMYYSLAQVKYNDFVGPDVFVALDVPTRERKSWVAWEEGKTPDVVIELLSESTAKYDKTTKKDLYQNKLKVTEYFWFDPFNPDDRAGFRLNGGHYQAIPMSAEQALESKALGLKLVLWRGRFGNAETVWLRWATLEGELLPLPVEAAEKRVEVEAQARRNAELELAQQRQEIERLRALLNKS